MRAIQQATEMSAYRHASPCLAGAAADADCLQTVTGAVTAVTEFPGGYRISPDYALDVQTTSTTLHLTFSSDSPMLSYAVTGDPAVVTMWRGVPVAVVADARSQATTSVPETALARDLGNSEESVGIGIFLVFGGLATRRRQKTAGVRPPTRPVVLAALSAFLLAGLVAAIGGWALGGKPSRLGPDLDATGAALVAVLGLSAWLGFSVKRRAGSTPVRADGVADNAHRVFTSTPPLARVARTPLRTRIRPARWARVLRASAVASVPTLLTVAVLFGVLLTGQDGPHARAFRQAPACIGETNLATCAGDFTAVINGIRAPADDSSGAEVSYVTAGGAINSWAIFDGNTAAIVRVANADENADSPLRISVWRRSIIGAELGGSWHWAQNNPPGDTIPAAFLAVGFALLLLVMRLRIHRRAGSGTSRQRLLIDDLGQVAAAAGAVVLLAYGFWPGAILALAVLLWLGLSARQSARPKRPVGVLT